MELQALAQQAQPVKRKREEEGKKKGDDEEGEGEGAAAGPSSAKKRKPAKKKDAKGAAGAAGSLAGWRPKRAAGDAEGGTGAVETGEKKPLMIMKYLDGHTCAVRRRVHMKDIL